MTLDLILICILSVPIAGIAAIRAGSARQFVLRYHELVGLTGTYHELALSTGDDLAGNETLEEAMTQPIDNNCFKVSERLGGLPEMASRSFGAGRSVMHCITAPSYL
jgi:hypothetical protein